MFLKATGERTELEQAASSTALVMVHVGLDLSMFHVCVKKEGAVGLPASGRPFWFCDASSPFFFSNDPCLETGCWYKLMETLLIQELAKRTFKASAEADADENNTHTYHRRVSGAVDI